MYVCELEPRPLVLVFIGYDEEQTRRYFAEFAKINADQVSRFDEWEGRIRLRDGTSIWRISNNPACSSPYRFDQMIVAADARGFRGWPEKRLEFLGELYTRVECERVPWQSRIIIYDLGSEVKINEN